MIILLHFKPFADAIRAFFTMNDTTVRQQKYPVWLWMIPIFLMMSGLVMLRLNSDGLWYDELYSVRNSGGSLYGPLNPLGIVQRVIETDPYQALGYPLFLGGWGAFVGWTAFASRVSSWLIGMISLAITYRMAAAILASKWGAILTALILSVSAFFIYFNHELRAFTLVTLFAATLIWSYIHILTYEKQPSRWAYWAFVLSGTGLLYAHYYTALLLVGLALYHILFARKDRRWWWLTGLATCVGLLFIPQIPGFLAGFILFEPENLGQAAMTAPEIMQTLLYYAGNGWLIPTSVILIAGMVAAWRHPNGQGIRIVMSIALLSIGVTLLANTALEMLEPRRIRYVIFLMPLIAIWLAWGLLAITQWLTNRFKLQAQQRRIIIAVLLMLILGNGVIANTSETFTDSLEPEPIPRFHPLVTALSSNLAPNDVLAFYNGNARDAYYMQEILQLALADVPIETVFTANLYLESTRDDTQARLAQADRIWYGINKTLPLNTIHTQFLTLLEQDYIPCGEYIDADDMQLTLWTQIATFCSSDNVQIAYDRQFTLIDTALSQTDEQLTVHFNWQINASVPPETYSLGVYIVETATETIVHQVDNGFPSTPYLTLTTQFDLTDEMPSGMYDIRVVVYQWRTQARLIGVTEAGSTGNYLTVGQFNKP